MVAVVGLGPLVLFSLVIEFPQHPCLGSNKLVFGVPAGPFQGDVRFHQLALSIQSLVFARVGFEFSGSHKTCNETYRVYLYCVCALVLFVLVSVWLYVHAMRAQYVI